jgi:Loader and inhibitor of phage G40P
MTPNEVGKLVAYLKAAYPRATIEPDTLEVYRIWLSDLPYEPARAAVVTIIATERFFPTVAEIREAAAQLVTGVPVAEAAWAEVMAAVREHGMDGWPEWSHPAVAEAVRAIGWHLICGSTNVATERAHFLRIYAAMRESVLRGVTVAGLLEASSAKAALKAGA